VSSLVQAAVVGELDFGQVLLGAVSAGLSAGILNVVNTTFFAEAIDTQLLPKSMGGAELDLTQITGFQVAQSILKTVSNAAIRAGVSSALTDAEFKDVFVDNLKSGAVNNLVEPIGFAVAGDLISVNSLVPGSPEAALIHAVVGGIGGAIVNGARGAAAGALGALLGELVLPADRNTLSADQIQGMIVTQQLIGMLASVIAGDESMSGVDAAVNGFSYNYLKKHEIAAALALEQRRLQCKKAGNECSDEEKADIAKKTDDLKKASFKNLVTLHETCASEDRVACAMLMQELKEFKDKRDYQKGFTEDNEHDGGTNYGDLTQYEATLSLKGVSVDIDTIYYNEWMKYLSDETATMTVAEVEKNIIAAVAHDIITQARIAGVEKIAAGAIMVSGTSGVAGIAWFSDFLLGYLGGTYLVTGTEQMITGGDGATPLQNALIASGVLTVEQAATLQTIVDFGTFAMVLVASGIKLRAITETVEKVITPKSRPKYAKGQVETVWKNAMDADGRVFDRYTGKELFWDMTQPRNNQWHMGHNTGDEYSKLYKRYAIGRITKQEYISIYRDPARYSPQDPAANMSHIYEQK
jgi:hypothetical protein